MSSKIDRVETQQTQQTQRPNSYLDRDEDALATELFSTSRDPNRPRAPLQALPQAPRARVPLPDGPTLWRTSARDMAVTQSDEERGLVIARLGLGRPVQISFPPSPSDDDSIDDREIAARLRIYSTLRIDPGPGLRGLPISSSVETLPLYEPREGEASSTVRRPGTGLSMASQLSGPPPSYHSTWSRQGTWSSLRDSLRRR